MRFTDSSEQPTLKVYIGQPGQSIEAEAESVAKTVTANQNPIQTNVNAVLCNFKLQENNSSAHDPQDKIVDHKTVPPSGDSVSHVV